MALLITVWIYGCVNLGKFGKNRQSFADFDFPQNKKMKISLFLMGVIIMGKI